MNRWADGWLNEKADGKRLSLARFSLMFGLILGSLITELVCRVSFPYFSFLLCFPKGTGYESHD